ncbi:chlorophyll a-b binding protein 4 chloroplastic-like, partial [Trifolium medium]|nr:chlorophyll a-b binding protein 4 chloroplastic-like [Trifolium medium]
MRLQRSHRPHLSAILHNIKNHNAALLRVAGVSNIPVWYEAGAVKYEFANTGTLV